MPLLLFFPSPFPTTTTTNPRQIKSTHYRRQHSQGDADKRFDQHQLLFSLERKIHLSLSLSCLSIRTFSFLSRVRSMIPRYTGFPKRSVSSLSGGGVDPLREEEAGAVGDGGGDASPSDVLETQSDRGGLRRLSTASGEGAGAVPRYPGCACRLLFGMSAQEEKRDFLRPPDKTLLHL